MWKNYFKIGIRGHVQFKIKRTILFNFHSVALNMHRRRTCAKIRHLKVQTWVYLVVWKVVDELIGTHDLKSLLETTIGGTNKKCSTLKNQIYVHVWKYHSRHTLQQIIIIKYCQCSRYNESDQAINDFYFF